MERGFDRKRAGRGAARVLQCGEIEDLRLCITYRDKGPLTMEGNGGGNETRSTNRLVLSTFMHAAGRGYRRSLIAKTAGNCDVLLLRTGRITVITRRSASLFLLSVSNRVLPLSAISVIESSGASEKERKEEKKEEDLRWMTICSVYSESKMFHLNSILIVNQQIVVDQS